MVCRVIGGAYSDFAGTAAPWVFFGIGLSGALTYLSTMEKHEKGQEMDDSSGEESHRE